MKYFSIEELVKSASAERLAIDNTPPHAARRMLTILIEQLLDPIRRRYGAPIIVTSGYRCPALNTAVGGVANSHHIVGCAADIKAPLLSPQGGKTPTSISVSSPLGGTEGGQNLALFHLIVQMQREGQIHFTQLIAEEGYRWLHISYVPGMLRNQVIDVNVNDDCYPLRTTCSSPLKRDSAESTEYSTNQDELSPFKGRSEAFRGLAKCQAVPSEGSAVLCTTEADRERREQSERSGGGQEKSSSTSKKDYQDSG